MNAAPAPTFVTTAERPAEGLIARAHIVASRCGLPFRARNGSLTRTAGGQSCYVVGRRFDELWSPSARTHVHQGLTLARAHDGLEHPLIRAIAPDGRATRLADGTLGLAQDALHLSLVLGATLIGCEVSPVVFSLCEEGLGRLARTGRIAEAARRIEARLGDSAALLAGEPDDAFDAVLLSPMFTEPDRAPIGYEAFRGAATHAPVSAETVRQALRVAPRLVIKARPGEPVPVSLQERPRHVLSGRALEYWVFER